MGDPRQEDPLIREWLPTPVFLPGEFHGQRRLAGYRPCGGKELDTTEQLTLSLFLLSYKYICIRVFGEEIVMYMQNKHTYKQKDNYEHQGKENKQKKIQKRKIIVYEL